MVRGKVLTEGKLLFVGDDGKRVQIERDTRIRYLDYKLSMDRLNHQILRRMAEEGR